MKRLSGKEELSELRRGLKTALLEEDGRKIKICCGTACRAMGSLKVLDALRKEAGAQGGKLGIVTTGCQGLCQKGPLMKIEPEGYFYQRVGAAHVPKIMANTINAGFPVRELFYRDSSIKEPIEKMQDVPFYRKQQRLVLKNNEMIDPEDIFQYIAHDGYSALEKALFTMTPMDVIDEIKLSGLRGRGGAGFPSGIKWEAVRRSAKKTKIVVANGDEGDPGAFMDRSIMEGTPHSLIEGMIICAYAVGAEIGFIYVRHEYPLAVKNLKTAIGQARGLGILGENILGLGFSFDISIREGAGAFVCGEETALLASIEGRRGFPKQKPPFPAERGAWDYPTCINNIETFANVPFIALNGSEAYAALGTEKSKGTKVFALTGKIRNTGLIEVPMGITLREIIYDIGGGIIGGRKLKAVQTGGPSGGCIPANLIDLKVDFDSLFEVGSMMGSGGLVVMDEADCMVDVAKFFLSFTQSESCGKCPPCRIGTYQMLGILEKITKGEGEPADIGRLEDLGRKIKDSSLCGLGKTAPNPVISTIRYFREEYEEHVHGKYCRAKVCKGLGLYTIEAAECFLCGLCKEACAYGAVKETRRGFFIDQDLCTKCKACYDACPIDAVKISRERHARLLREFKIPPKDTKGIERRTRMTLKDLLTAKPYGIIGVKKDCKIADAIRLMCEKNISGLFILDENDGLLGIFTERDIKCCVAQGISLVSETIESVMRKELTTFKSTTEISMAITIALRKKIRHLPVVDGEKVMGMITFRDLVTYLLPEVCYYSESAF